MSRDEALTLLLAHRNELDQFGVTSLALFGSVARDEARPDSDVDVLVEFRQSATFAGYLDLKQFLERLFNRPVDLATPRALRPAIRSRIASELQHVS